MLTGVIVASLPPRPPPASLPTLPPPASLPSHPTQAQPDASDHGQWHGIRVQFARLQYRDNEDQDWLTIDDSYEPYAKTSKVSEPYNVEQVYFLETGGIQLRQCDTQWDPQINKGGHKEIEVPISSWIVTFKGISNIIVSEKEDKYKWCIFLFTCVEAPKSEHEILRPEIETDEEVADPSTFPLAALIQDPVSTIIAKQFRLAFQRKTFKSKSFAFTWPAVLNCLAGIPFVYKKKDDWEYNLSLDEWAMRNKKSLASFTLRDVQPRKPNEPWSEWHLERPQALQASQLKSSASTPLSLPGPYSSLPVIRSPYDSTMNWSSSAAGLAPPFAPVLAPSSNAELPTFAPRSVVQMPPSIRPPQTSRTYDEAIEEGDAMAMEGVIQALAETLRQKKLRAEEAQMEADKALKEVIRARKEVDSAQLLLNDANRKQKHMFIAERSKGK